MTDANAEPDPIAEAAGDEILPVPETAQADAPVADQDGPREIEFPDRLLVDDLDEIEQWAAENDIPLQPRPARIPWVRYGIVAVTLLALTAYAIIALT